MKSSAESIHLDGVFLSVKYAMRRAGGGSIIMTSSVAGLRESAGLARYCATKGGVRLFAKAVAMECAAEADGIRVNTVHLVSSTRRSGRSYHGPAGATCRSTRTRSPKRGVARQGGQAQDIANGVLFLASDASDYMTGRSL